VQRRLTPDETRAVANEYLAGSSMHEISARWVINRETVATALRRAGVEARQPEALTAEELQEAQALFESGWSLNQLGKKFGIDPKTIKKRLTAAEAEEKVGQFPAA
jgi:DNA-directed RNA polymerase specialized sigma24 family protein